MCVFLPILPAGFSILHFPQLIAVATTGFAPAAAAAYCGSDCTFPAYGFPAGCSGDVCGTALFSTVLM